MIYAWCSSVELIDMNMNTNMDINIADLYRVGG
jgi:hypothetical protein